MNRTLSLFIAMLLAGVAGYFVLWLSIRRLDPVDYALFAAFWSALYFLVGSLSGLQQEVTRASHSLKEQTSPARSAHRRASWNLAFYSAGGMLLIGAVIGFVTHFVGAGNELSGLIGVIAPMTLALASYVLVAIIAGSLYGIQKWSLLAWMIFGDAFLRLIFVVWTLNTSAEVDILLWGVSLPFGLTILLLAPWLMKALKGKVVTDVKATTLSINALQAILAAAGMSMIVSGFPILLAVTARDVTPTVLSQSMFIVTLARAPFVIVAVSLQSLFLVKFKEQTAPTKLILKVGLGFLGLTIFLLPLGLVFSQPILELLLGTPAQLSPWMLTSVVLSGLLLALLVITGVAVLAQNKHLQYVAGWSVAALVTLIFLMLPIEFEYRLICSLLIAPLVGISIHLTSLSRLVK